jgi:steroid 5-alpha reductase family enzyme
VSWPVLLLILVMMLAIMNVAWIYQRAAGDSGWIDVFWTFGTGLAGVVAALFSLPGEPEPTARAVLAAALIAIWAVRLGSYITVRVARGPEDSRYAHFRRDWGENYQRTLWVFVMPQTLFSTLLCVSIMVAANRPAPGLDLRDLLAFAVLAIAIGGEALADAQLARFKKGGAEKGAVCDTGLWAWSRHPNYFFEWFGWLAWPVMAFNPANPVTWLTWLAPVAMFVVLRFVTGVPPLEQTMAQSRGAKYRAYQSRTSAFIPLPPKSGA